MNIIVKTQALTYSLIIALALGLSACASTLGFIANVTGTEIVTEDVKAKAYKAANVALVAYEHVQLLMLEYKRLLPCVNGKPLICRSSKAWVKIQEIDKKTNAILQAQRPIIEAGTDDVQLLMAIPAVVYDAKAAFEKAKEEK